MRKPGLVLYCLLQLWLSSAHAQAPVTNFSATPTSGCGPLDVQFTDNSTNSPVFWSWDFGNGQTSSLQNPYIQFATAGTYTVTLITRNASGSDAMRKTGYITVYPYPQASFTSNSTLACAPTNIEFTDNSVPGAGSITSYLWNFGDGTTSNQQNPAHTYSQPGYYGVALTVQNSGGCSNTAGVTRYLRVVDGIQANFVFNQSSTSCTAPFTGTLLNQTAGPGTLTYNWTIANGATPANSTATNPIITFPNAATYNVTLQVSSTYGCSATFTDTLNLADNSAVINGPTTVCVNTPATFTNGSTPIPPSFTWTFGDGTTSNAPSPSKTFPTAGTTSVTLVNKYAGCTTTKTDPITVINPPTPAFTATNASGCKAPLTVSFTDHSTPTPASWLWNFGDGQTSTAQNPNHTYTTTGTFNVTLTIEGTGSACPGSTTINSFVSIQGPTVTIGGTLSACTKGTGSLSVITPVANVNAPDGVATYAWSAPGSVEGSSTAAAPTFTYNTANSYTVSVTVTTNGGCTATASKGVQIGTPVSPAFTASETIVCGNALPPVAFTATNQNPAYTYYWVFGDGQDSTVTAPPNPPPYTISHSYLITGSFPVTLTVTNNGCPSTAPTVTIVVSPPIPNFGYHVNCPANALSVNFIDSSQIDAAVGNYTWDFGDGSPTSTAPGPYSPTHTYPVPGSYPVTLTVADGTCTNSVTKNIVVAGVTPSFTIDNNTPCENGAFNLTSTSTTIPNTPGTVLIANYAWTVGSNTAGGNPFQTAISTPGNYTATLVVTDINGCTYASAPSPVTVTGPIAGFTGPTIGGGCSNQFTIFNDASTPYPGNTTTPPLAPPSPLTSRTYIFGDGQSQTFYAPPYQHQYTDSGKLNVQLIVSDAKGCTSTFLGTVQIDSPVANFSIPDSFYCPNAPLTFTDGSQGYNLLDAWSFNDATGGTANPHTFPAAGAYTATLTVTDRYNCTNAITKTVNIKTPIAAFNDYDTTAICTPLETTFAAHNQFSDSLYWDFGDGTTSTLDSTFHFYNNFGTFTVTLYAQGPGGCQTSISKKVYVEDPNAVTTLNFSPLRHCDSVNAQFNITPAPYTSFLLSFGDNFYDSSGNLTPMHVYRLPGAYQPVIQLTDKTGCIVDLGSPLGNIYVLGATPFFSVDKHAFCDSSIVNFTDYTISNDGLTSETYNFGDGSPADGITPGTGTFNASHDYVTAGNWIPKLTVTTTDNCTESYTDTIRVYQTPHPSISTSSLLCTGLIQFNGSLTTPQVDTITWAWNFGDNQQSSLQNPAVNMTPGTYTVTLQTSTSFGCQRDTNTSITIFGPPTIKGPPEVTAPVGMPVTLPMTYSADVVSYAWTPATNLDCPTCPNPAATLLFSAEYYVTATDKNSCTATDSIFVKTICNSQNYFLPNTFSPNGDGVNDYFYPRGTSIYNVRSLTVFNRWGQMVFQRRDFPANAENMGWDGTFGGKPAPADAYVYIVEVVCDNSQVVAIHGSVTLVR